MNREIKFRAWNIRFKEWTTLGMFHAKDKIFGLTEHEDIVAMQYTGLKDKNGKEIYEGDIIRKIPAEWISKTDDSISLDEYLKSIASIGIVEYSLYQFVLANYNYEKTYLTYSDKIYDGYGHGSIEVIGNIYENPELITPPS